MNEHGEKSQLLVNAVTGKVESDPKTTCPVMRLLGTWVHSLQVRLKRIIWFHDRVCQTDSLFNVFAIWHICDLGMGRGSRQRKRPR
jgi:hypothetical protein